LLEIDCLDGLVTLTVKPDAFELGDLGLEALTYKRMCFGELFGVPTDVLEVLGLSLNP
jgi:hypothetical protein